MEPDASAAAIAVLLRLQQVAFGADVTPLWDLHLLLPPSASALAGTGARADAGGPVVATWRGELPPEVRVRIAPGAPVVVRTRSGGGGWFGGSGPKVEPDWSATVPLLPPAGLGRSRFVDGFAPTTAQWTERVAVAAGLPGVALVRSLDRLDLPPGSVPPAVDDVVRTAATPIPPSAAANDPAAAVPGVAVPGVVAVAEASVVVLDGAVGGGRVPVRRTAVVLPGPYGVGPLTDVGLDVLAGPLVYSTRVVLGVEPGAFDPGRRLALGSCLAVTVDPARPHDVVVPVGAVPIAPPRALAPLLNTDLGDG